MIILYGLAALGVYLIVYGEFLDFLEGAESFTNKDYVVYAVDDFHFLNNIRMMNK